MPVIGDIKYGHEIGRKNSMRFQWCACVGCGKERWVTLVKGKPENDKCVACCKIGMKLTHAKQLDHIPIIDEIRTNKELGLRGKPNSKNIWELCPNCGVPRWVQLKAKGKYPKCRKCLNKGKIGKVNGMWKGGKKLNHKGYILVRKYPDNPYYEMANPAGYVFEHRLVMAQHLGRCLHDWEEVHHRDSIKTHNTPDNLFVTDASNHNKLVEQVLKYQESEIKDLKSRVTLLEAENTVLKTDMSEFV